MSRTRRVNCIIPPHLLDKLLDSEHTGVRKAALDTMLTTARLRGERGLRASFVGAASAGNGRRTVFDCQQGRLLPTATLAQSEDGAASTDESVRRAFDGLGTTRDFYRTVLQRNSVDDRGMRLDGYVHFDVKFNNAFWDGRQMVFGDGDGTLFTDFTRSLDVIAHELTHAVTEFTAGLAYHGQSGALNESMSDVFGSVVKQWSLNQSAEVADWLIGAEVFTPEIDADALRSMKAPGHAYDNELFGKDPQPDHMSHFAHLPDNERGDFGGVHINSGIPNKAFYLTATNIGGSSWGAPALIWYESLKASSIDTQFQGFADTTHQKAEELYGAGSNEQLAVLAAWQEVGIQVSGVPAGVARDLGRAGRNGAPGRTAGQDTGGAARDDGLTALNRQIDALASQVASLSKAMTAMQREHVTRG
ncbi:M4 family metallopeptidase [Streptomyces graminilatus]|uniref:M4 family metallopeptidase n=1 Tax=Streptomyces graminilatus TaxID=1464070 RepID=UPI0006E3DABB|nr:M4 family metallopeptidase [Streptomyces graminilatus]